MMGQEKNVLAEIKVQKKMKNIPFDLHNFFSKVYKKETGIRQDYFLTTPKKAIEMEGTLKEKKL